MVPDGNHVLGGPLFPRPEIEEARKTTGVPKEIPPRRDGAFLSSYCRRHDVEASLRRPASSAQPLLLSLTVFLISAVCCVEARSYDFSYGSGSTPDNYRITCYTCMNVSTNEECNRYAIDRPCPEGRDYCLTLHVMDGLELDRSVLVNKRCAYLDECTGDSTGCTTSDGQTQCVSCCDQPYCNDYVPSNETSAMFHRSSAPGTMVRGAGLTGPIWRLAAVLLTAFALHTSSLSWLS